ncbi:hypothetical protein EGW08_005212 [Elysia chlorotica]|uniref:Innexin n=1 Tax=Elysia chlorotica TaxID=188477 RepID=A0A433TZQ4_ELYCH|nr:hypothetical protein EGW08_005212 [Elysia chlorotica]
MSVFRRSLAEDKIDHYTHTWSVLFLLVLALVTWLLPLSPYLQLQNDPSSSAIPLAISQVTPSEPVIPRFKARCWSPAQFTDAMVEYSQAACSSAYNLALQGIDPESSGLGVTLYEPVFTFSSPGDFDDTKFKPVVRKSNSQKRQIKVKTPEGKEGAKTQKALNFIQTKTPFVLFLLAVFLKVPHLVWILLSALTGGINIDQILTSAKAGTGLSYDSRRQLLSELASSIVGKCSGAASFLYLLLKVLVCVAVIAELVVVQTSILPEAESLEKDFAIDGLNGDVMSTVNTTLKTLEKTENNSTDYADKLLMCELNIREFTNVKAFTLQCVFQPELENVAPKPATNAAVPRDDRVSRSPRGVMKMYVTVFLVVQTLLVVLTVVNVSSFLVWLLKFLLRPRKPLDLCLLLHMANENAGPEVSNAFSQSEVGGKGDGKESIPLSE